MGTHNYLRSISNASSALRSRGLTSGGKFGGYNRSFASSYNAPSESGQSASKLGDYLSGRRAMDRSFYTGPNDFLNKHHMPGTSGFLNRSYGASGDRTSSQQGSQRSFDRSWSEAESKTAPYPDTSEPPSSTPSSSPSSNDSIDRDSSDPYTEPPLSEDEQHMWDNAINLAKEDVKRGKYSKVIDELNIRQSDDSQSVSTGLPASFTSHANSSESYQESPLSEEDQAKWDNAIRLAKGDQRQGRYSKILDELGLYSNSDNSRPRSSIFYDNSGNSSASKSDTNLDRYDSDTDNDNASVYSAQSSTCQRCGGSRSSFASPRKRRGKAKKGKKGKKGKKRRAQKSNYTSFDVNDSSYAGSNLDEYRAETARIEAQNASDLADALYESRRLARETKRIARNVARLSSGYDSAY